jgi:hypothetical protein
VTIYAESTYPVRKDLGTIHARQISALGDPGTWGTGAQRLAIAQEARAALYSAGVQEANEAPQIAEADLPEAARRVARQLAIRPQDFDREVYDAAIADGLTDAAYTEHASRTIYGIRLRTPPGLFTSSGWGSRRTCLCV